MPTNLKTETKTGKTEKRSEHFMATATRSQKVSSLIQLLTEGTGASVSSNIASAPDVQVQASSSAQKMNDSISQFPDVENSCEGYRLFQKSGLVDFIQTFPCPSCFNISDSNDPTFKILETLNGIESELRLICTLCNAPVASLSNSENLNMRFQLAMPLLLLHYIIVIVKL